MSIQPQIHPSWLKVLQNEFQQPYFIELKSFLQDQKSQGKLIYPPGSLIFNAFNSAPFDAVKVVILGQDPYHGKGQAHGLSFSVPTGIKPPPSLVNIFKEQKEDLALAIPSQGNLQHWADQGVFLLNAILTVEAHQPASHQKKGWENFTDAVIRLLSEKREGLVFMLWGNFAKSKATLIDAHKHMVLKAAHPSPFSAYNGFFGCKHFSKANEELIKQGKEAIDWSLQ